ncbi:MAG: putative metal-binding motif-containing protein [Myxococcota bacterium]|nr:putative metal-binding motif-containing protein [Myxococcota bacterium]
MPGDMDGDGLDDIVVGAPGVPADQDAIPGAAHLLLSRLHADHDGDGLGISGGDCDDGDPESYPGATERCDGADNDCDGVVPLDEHDEDDDGHMPCGGDCDDADPERYPADADGDGYGPCDGDCDDGDPELDPGDRDGDGYSTCDGDCDDSDPDRDLGDLDGDGWSSCGAVRDCDDHDASIHPDADETGDGVDNDCDGLVDEGVPTAMGCGWSDAGRSADLMRPGAFLALGLLLSLRIRPRRRDPAGMRRPRSTPRG